MNDMFPNFYHREKDMNWIINNFIAWAMNKIEDNTVQIAFYHRNETYQ